MNRSVSIIATALALVAFLPATTAHSGGKPVRAPITDADQTFDYDAGLACPFELLQEPVVNREVTTTYPPDAKGDVRENITGDLVMRYTNVATGKSITLKIAGPGTYVFHPDGSTSIDYRGNNVYVLYPSDTPHGPSTTMSSGPVKFEIDPDGNFTLTSFTGHVVLDVCAALS